MQRYTDDQYVTLDIHCALRWLDTFNSTPFECVSSSISDLPSSSISDLPLLLWFFSVRIQAKEGFLEVEYLKMGNDPFIDPVWTGYRASSSPP